MIYDRGQLRWIESGGGPLLLLPAERLTAWTGHTLKPEMNGQSSNESDYERACAVEDYIGVVAVAGTESIVLGDEPMATAWVPVSATEGIITRWVCGEDQARACEYLGHIEEGIWRSTGVSLVVEGGPLYLFDAAWPGSDVTVFEYLTLSLDAGNYSFDTGTLYIGGMVELILHRLRRIQAIEP